MKEQNLPTKVEISYKTVVFTVGFLICLWFLVKIRSIIILIFLSIILVSALSRPVEWLVAKKIPRILAQIIIYILIIILFAFTIGTIVPLLVSQTTEFVSRTPQIFENVNNFLLFNNVPVQDVSSIISKQAQQFAGDIFSISSAIISSVVLIITVFVLTFYLLLEWKIFARMFATAFSPKHEKRVLNIISKVQDGLGNWVRAQLTLSITVGVLIFTGLRILSIPYALPLALIAGILEIVPIVGPIIAAIPAILVGLTISPVIALAAAALFVIIQQMENHLIVPVLMSKVVGLQPPIVIIGLLIGTKLYGVAGAFLAVPVIVVIKILIKELLSEDTAGEI